MKTRIFTIIAIMMMFGSIFAFSQSSYYYYKGIKIPINEDRHRVTVITPKGKSAKILRSVSTIMESSKTLEDENFDISVLRLDNTTKFRQSYGTILHSLKQDDATIVLPCYTTETRDELTMTHYLNIKLKNIKDIDKLKSIANKYNLEIVEQNKFMPLWYILRITNKTVGTTLQVANRIYESGEVASALADFVSDNDLLCSYDPLIAQQWGLYNSTYPNNDISICSAWSYATGRGIKIAVVDVGIDLNHRDLAANIYSLSYDTESGTSPSRLYGSHGTHCAGIAAAVRNNGLQVAGVAPDAKLMSISNSLNSSTNSRIKRADGINWAWRNGADIISNSWGSGTKHDAIDDAIDLALTSGRNGRGCIIVFAAGNESTSVSYPANYRPEIIAVGAIENTGNKALYSNFGANLDIMAPGSNILSTLPHHNTDFNSGTSMACPHVAGIAALILERNPRLTCKQVTDIIEKSAKKVGNMSYGITKENGSWNDHYGYGLINAYNAIINTPRPRAYSNNRDSDPQTEQNIGKIELITPNPIHHMATIKYILVDAANSQIIINSLSGFSIKRVYNLPTDKNEIKIDLSNYPKGFYAVFLISNGKIIDSSKIIKQ